MTPKRKDTSMATPHHTPAAIATLSNKWMARKLFARDSTKSKPLRRPHGVKSCTALPVKRSWYRWIESHSGARVWRTNFGRKRARMRPETQAPMLAKKFSTCGVTPFTFNTSSLDSAPKLPLQMADRVARAMPSAKGMLPCTGQLCRQPLQSSRAPPRSVAATHAHLHLRPCTGPNDVFLLREHAKVRGGF